MKYNILGLVALVTATAASPLQKRQADSTSLVVPPATTSLDSAGSATASGASASDASVMPMSSAMATAMSSVMSPAMPSAMPSMTDGSGDDSDSDDSDGESSALYPCPEGYLLTYVDVQMTYDASVDDVVEVAGTFQNATWMYYLNGTGGNEAGATRYLATAGGAKTEVLSEYFTDQENVAVQLVMNLTSGPIMTPNGAMLSNYSTVFQIYNNQSASTTASQSTTGKLFCNFCAADQASGQQAVMMNFEGALQNIATLLSGGDVTYPGSSAGSPAGPMSSMDMSASMMASASMMSSASMDASAAPSMMSSATGSAGMSSDMPMASASGTSTA